jgi:hypothetical protein
MDNRCYPSAGAPYSHSPALSPASSDTPQKMMDNIRYPSKSLHIASDESAPVPVSTTAPPFVFACRPILSVRQPCDANWHQLGRRLRLGPLQRNGDQGGGSRLYDQDDSDDRWQSIRVDLIDELINDIVKDSGGLPLYLELAITVARQAHADERVVSASEVSGALVERRALRAPSSLLGDSEHYRTVEC